MTHKQLWKTGDKKQKTLRQTTKKNKPYTHRTKFNKKQTKHLNSEQESQNKAKAIDVISNPFCKEIDRHFGSFKTRVLGNTSKVFNSLPFASITPLGRKATGCRRKVFRSEGFTAVFYSNGTVVIKPERKASSSPNAPEVLQADYFAKAREAVRLLECYSLTLAPIEMNQVPKYGVEDLTARVVNKEVKGRFRAMDSSARIVKGKLVRRTPHIDDFGAAAAARNNQFSEKQHFELAKARITNPEYFDRLEKSIEKTVDAGVVLGNHMATHVGIMKEIRSGLHELASGVRSVRQSRHRFPSSLKKSATVRGCN